MTIDIRSFFEYTTYLPLIKPLEIIEKETRLLEEQAKYDDSKKLQYIWLIPGRICASLSSMILTPLLMVINLVASAIFIIYGKVAKNDHYFKEGKHFAICSVIVLPALYPLYLHGIVNPMANTSELELSYLSSLYQILEIQE